MNADDIKQDSKAKLAEGERKFQETKDRLFGKDQNGDDEAPEDDDDMSMWRDLREP